MDSYMFLYNSTVSSTNVMFVVTPNAEIYYLPPEKKYYPCLIYFSGSTWKQTGKQLVIHTPRLKELPSMYGKSSRISLEWRHNDHDGVSNNRPHDCLLNRLFRRRSKKTSKLCVTGLCARNSLVTGEFPAQRNSNADFLSIWWRHHVGPQRNKPISQIPQSIRQISHNASFLLTKWCIVRYETGALWDLCTRSTDYTCYRTWRGTWVVSSVMGAERYALFTHKQRLMNYQWMQDKSCVYQIRNLAIIVH